VLPVVHRAVVESVHKLDVIIGGKASYREVFKPENISLRNKYVCVCVGGGGGRSLNIWPVMLSIVQTPPLS